MADSASDAQRSGDGIDLGRLGDWLEGHVEGFRGPFTIIKFAGGQSNPTYRIDAASGRYVMRRKPFGPTLPSAHAVDREYRVISALRPVGYPVARPYALCSEAEVIGAPFYIMEMVEGRTFWDGRLPDQSPTERRAIYLAMVDALAGLHRIEPEAVGLQDYGPPGNYFERQVARWTKQYRASQTDDVPEVERLIAWLPATLPHQSRVSIIHGDYRIDNILFAPASGEVLAVLDWELSTLGDPLADFAYLAMNWAMPAGEHPATIGGLDWKVLGIPTLDEVTARYCAATGREGVANLNWHFAFNLFRLVGIVQGIKKRFLEGSASSAQAEQAGSRVPMLARRGWEFACRAGAGKSW
jgi:aminoglycoside phosphotransferase (APT) family kinase protein